MFILSKKHFIIVNPENFRDPESEKILKSKYKLKLCDVIIIM